MIGPDAKAESSYPRIERPRLRRIIAERNLCGLANDTKWNELLEEMRKRRLADAWVPSFRFKTVDAYVSGWDAEWFHHLPFPMICVEWLDLPFLVETREHRIPPKIHVTDHSEWIGSLLGSIHFDYRRGTKMFRIFGYGPRDLALFDD